MMRRRRLFETETNLTCSFSLRLSPHKWLFHTGTTLEATGQPGETELRNGKYSEAQRRTWVGARRGMARSRCSGRRWVYLSGVVVVCPFGSRDAAAAPVRGERRKKKTKSNRAPGKRRRSPTLSAERSGQRAEAACGLPVEPFTGWHGAGALRISAGRGAVPLHA